MKLFGSRRIEKLLRVFVRFSASRWLPHRFGDFVSKLSTKSRPVLCGVVRHREVLFTAKASWQLASCRTIDAMHA